MQLWIAVVLAVAGVLVFLSREDTRRFVGAVRTKVTWERSLQHSAPVSTIEVGDHVDVYVATTGVRSPSYVALIPTDDGSDRVVITLADPDSLAGFPPDVPDEGLHVDRLADYFADWGLRAVSAGAYRDAILARHFGNLVNS